VRTLALAHAARPGPLLPILHAVQDQFGHVPSEAVPVIAEVLNLSRAEVHGVVSYYHHFRIEPAGGVLLQLCQAEACQARGASELAREAEKIAGCAMHATHPDGSISLEPVYCLGLCAMGPAVMVNGRPHGRVSVSRLRGLIDAARVARTEPVQMLARVGVEPAVVHPRVGIEPAAVHPRAGIELVGGAQP
jgi:formate dehydrogenase subunit gamma